MTSATSLDRRIARLAVPALGSLATEPLYRLVDTAIVGRLGTAPLGGLALAATVLTSLLWVFNFLSFGTTARVAFLTGRGDAAGAQSAAVQGLWLCLAIGVPLAGAVLILGRPAAAALGGSGAVLDAAGTYVRISALGIPAVLIALVGNGWYRGLSDTRTPLYVMGGANLANVLIEVWFVFGLGLGVAGAAWSTVIAQWGAAAWFVGLMASRLRRTGASLRPSHQEMLRLVVVGRHLFVRTAALLATLAAATSVAARVDAVTLAAHQIAAQVNLFLAYTTDALAIAGQALVGTALGAGDRREARAVTRRLLRWGWLAGALLGAAIAALSPLLPRIFTSEPAVLSRATAALALVGLAQVPAAVAYVLDGVLMGGSDFRFLQWAMLAAALAFAPFAAAVLLAPSLGIAAIWGGLVVWMAARAALNGARAAGSRWTLSAR